MPGAGRVWPQTKTPAGALGRKPYMTKEIIARLNALAQKSRSQGLTEQEKEISVLHKKLVLVLCT